MNYENMSKQELLEIITGLQKYKNTAEKLAMLSNIMICTFDLQGRILSASPLLCKMLGYEDEELYALNYYDIVHPDDRHLNFEGKEKLVTGEIEKYEIQKRYISKDGRIFWNNVYGELNRNSCGSPLSITVYVQDVTERKLMEQKLKDSYKELRQSRSWINQAERIAEVMFCHADLDNKIVKVSPNFCHLLGYSEAELISMRFTDITHPEDRDHNLSLKSKLINGEISFYEMEKRYIKKNGETVWVYINCTLALDDKGHPACILAAVYNITHKKELELKLINSDTQFQELLEFFPEPVFIVYEERYIYINQKAAELLGAKKRETVIGKDIFQFIHKESAELVKKRIDLVINKKQAVPFVDQKLKREDGKTIDIAAGSIPFVYDGKSMLLSIVTNISSSKQATRELEYTNELLKSYLYENEKLMFESKRFQHNAMNLFHGLGGYIHDEDWQGLKKYFNEMYEQLKFLKNTSLLSMHNLKNLAIKGLLAVKLSKAKELGINFKVEVQQPITIESGLIKETDLCELLGIYIDNALEAASGAPSSKVLVYILDTPEETCIIVENTFRERPEMSAVNKGTSTKGKDRGQGLKISRSIIEQYTNILNNTFIQHQVFVQELHIFKTKVGEAL